MVFSKESAYYAIGAVLAFLVVSVLLFAVPAWSQGDRAGESKQERKKAIQEKRAQSSSTRTERNRSGQDRVKAQRAGTQQVGAQAVDEEDDIRLSKVDEPDPVEVNGLLLYTIEVTNEDDSNDRTVVVRDDLPNSVELVFADIEGGDGNGECVEDDDEVFCEVLLLDATTSDDTATIQILVEPEQVGEIDNLAEVFDENGDCDVGAATPDCDGEEPVVRVIEDTQVVNDRNRDNRRDNRDRLRDRFLDDFFRDRFIDDFFEQYEDEDGFLSQQEQYEDAENDLEGETTDGQYDDEGGDGVSATADENGAEASTPGAVATAGDPDELAPETSVPGDVIDEIPTSGPLPETGGMSLFYWLIPLAGLLMLAGLPVYRWVKGRG